MTDIDGDLITLYTSAVERKNGEAVVEVPHMEVDEGSVDVDEVYRVALLRVESDEDDGEKRQGSMEDTAPRSSKYTTKKSGAPSHSASNRSNPQSPPVSEGDRRRVTIESLGDQGDGIAKIDRGYVLIVPETSPGDEVIVEIDAVRENVGFAKKIE